MTKTKATMLTQSILGNIIATPIWLIETGRTKYAQFESAPYVTYIKKNKRSARKLTIAERNPFLVIVAGWDTVQSQEAFKPAVGNISEGKFMSCDPAWVAEFERENKLENIIADYRGINVFERLAA